ncbi:hypothetical protein [Streptomyces sp. CS131]|uniref:hypothetical protein n=1 Tax=Streptomyces sp. CS131 TaxID=2162711 RepID=UPI0013A53C30|nr:hypothetical protein [Streptomyces sp. CS131]
MTNEGGSSGLVKVRALLLRTDWNAVEHCCPNVAPTTPVILRQLLDDDPRVRGTAVRELSEAVTHQGTFYSATAPAALFVAAVLGDPRTVARVTPQRPWEIELHGEKLSSLRVLLLDWLGDTAQNTNHPPEWPPGAQEDIDAFLTIRPALYDAVHPFLSDGEQEVRDAALCAILPLLTDSTPTQHVPALTNAVHQLAARDTPYRWYAVDRLVAWGQDTSHYPEPPQPGPNRFAGPVAQYTVQGDHDPWAGHVEPWPDSVYDALP